MTGEKFFQRKLIVEVGLTPTSLADDQSAPPNSRGTDNDGMPQRRPQFVAKTKSRITLIMDTPRLSYWGCALELTTTMTSCGVDP